MGRPYHPKDANEYPQHLTLITWDRIPHFLSSEVVECLLEMLEKERRRLHIEVYAFVVMPDHLHILVGPSTMPTGEVVRWMKMASGHWLRELGLIEGRVWSRGYWDKVIRDTRQLAAAIRYLHANPLKAGLAGEVEAYRYSSYGDYHGLWKSALEITSVPLW
jgi:putative transposase